MAQHDYILANAAGASFRADTNNALAAIVSQNSGPNQPNPTYAYQLWADTTEGLLKQRNAANNAWIVWGSLADAGLGLLSRAGGTMTGAITFAGSQPTATTAAAGIVQLNNDTSSTSETQAATPKAVKDVKDTALAASGYRNLLINGNPIINQRGYVSGTATTIANQYTLDRWRVVTSGQAISWTDSAGVRTVTAPAGGVEQVIESPLGGTHVLNWTGTATATVNGTAVTKGGTVTLTGGASSTVQFTGGTFSLPQLEPGAVATPFERRGYGIDLLLCQRYFLWVPFNMRFHSTVAESSIVQTILLPTQMRSTPAISAVVIDPALTQTNQNNLSNTVTALSNYGVHLTLQASAASTDTFAYGYRASLSAEL